VSSGLVRDAMPVERISKARIRHWLMHDQELGAWSRARAGAIRPARLASLIRDAIWRAHDVAVDAVADRLARSFLDTLTFRVEIEVNAPGEALHIVSKTQFTGHGGGRMHAEITLSDGPEPHRITNSPILLRNRST
jgi:hypothetical protein